MSGELHKRQAIFLDNDFLETMVSRRQHGDKMAGDKLNTFSLPTHTLCVLFLFAYSIQPLLSFNKLVLPVITIFSS